MRSLELAQELVKRLREEKLSASQAIKVFGWARELYLEEISDLQLAFQPPPVSSPDSAESLGEAPQ